MATRELYAWEVRGVPCLPKHCTPASRPGCASARSSGSAASARPGDCGETAAAAGLFLSLLRRGLHGVLRIVGDHVAECMAQGIGLQDEYLASTGRWASCKSRSMSSSSSLFLSSAPVAASFSLSSAAVIRTTCYPLCRKCHTTLALCLFRPAWQHKCPGSHL